MDEKPKYIIGTKSGKVREVGYTGYDELNNDLRIRAEIMYNEPCVISDVKPSDIKDFYKILARGAVE